MNKLSPEKRAQILSLLVEGMSIRAVVRVTGAGKNTIARLIVDAGSAFAEYQDRELRNLTCRRLQVDEAWAFCYAKKKNVPHAKNAPEGAGDVWTWVALDADTKLAVSWLVADRSGEAAKQFMIDVADRLKHRVQLTSDAYRAYLDAVEDAFGGDIDYAQLVKLYGSSPAGDTRYSPAECVGTRKVKVVGFPKKEHVSTSYAERQNLTMRMGMRRFTRLTNAFSKKFENHAHAVALHFMHYNFVRIHQTLRCTPAMAAGVTKTLWEMKDLVRIIDQWEEAQKR